MSYQTQHDLETGLIGSFLAVAGLAAFGAGAAPFVASAALFGAGLGMWLGRRR